MTNSNLEQYYDLALLFLRIGVGVIFIVAGWGKLTGIEGTQEFFGGIGIPAAGLMAWVVALVEFVGGLMVLLGLYLRIPALLLAIVMVVAIFTVKLEQGFSAMRIDLTLMLMSLSLVILGSGKLSFEHLFKG
jgi:putative oxidoreductase